MFPDIGHLQQIRVKANLSDAFTEGRLMKPRGAGGYDYPVQLVLSDVPLDFRLAGVSAGITVSDRNHHVGKLFSRPPYFFSIYRPCNIEPTIANEDAYSEVLFNQLACLLV
jgi:hypothetical protein